MEYSYMVVCDSQAPQQLLCTNFAESVGLPYVVIDHPLSCCFQDLHRLHCLLVRSYTSGCGFMGVCDPRRVVAKSKRITTPDRKQSCWGFLHFCSSTTHPTGGSLSRVPHAAEKCRKKNQPLGLKQTTCYKVYIPCRRCAYYKNVLLNAELVVSKATYRL